MLLLSVNVSAQTSQAPKRIEAETQQKYDLNGDGVVDVADINDIIAFMKNHAGAADGYFYLGTTQPTAENYRILPGVVTSYTSIDDAVGTAVSVAAGETLYMLCPAAWLNGKTVELEDNAENKISFLDEKDATTISGYVIYKTQVWSASNDVVLKTCCEKVFLNNKKRSNYEKSIIYTQSVIRAILFA